MRDILIHLEPENRFCLVSIDGEETFRTKEVDVEDENGEFLKAFQVEYMTEHGWDCDDEAEFSEFPRAFEALMSIISESESACLVDDA